MRDGIELLSGYSVVASRVDIGAHEVEALFDDLFGPSRRPVNAMHYLDWGVMRALGLDGTMRVVNEQGVDVTAEARENFPGGPVAFGSNGRR